ncbi:hypothetical protein HK099_004281 [Clydaea vesicula]|uniref:Uncharacterized protein n=1 Tax=Clydaea vesicula TaxID=447962 RepID=A0AAD5U8A0_9FUNG|nr:hypothetical protein HK099_004281 [Clydaea vesicula]
MALKKVLKSLIFFQFVQFSYQVPAVSSKIKTVVVTVLENRSFDSVAGFFDYDEKIDGILKITPCYNAVANNTNSQKFCVAKGLKNYVPFGPNHSVQGADHQIFGSNIRQDIPASELPSSPPMNGFLENNLNNFDVKDAQSYVSSFDPKTIPVITTLAKEFALFNRWFSSIPGPTQPNRAFVHSNTAAGMSDNDEKKMIAGYDQRNLYDILMENGYTVGNYWGE